SYLGFDAIATFAEESTGGTNLIGRATVTCLIIAGLLFAAQTYAGALLAPVSPDTLAAHPERQGEAYYQLVATQIAPWLSGFLAVAKAVGAAFSAMVGQAAASRVLLDMGRESRLPHVMAKVTARTRVPAVGLLVAAGVNVLIAVWAATQPSGLDTLVSIVDVGALCAFVLLHASVIGYFYVRRRTETRHQGRHLITPLAGATILVAVLVLASHRAQIVGAAWLIVGLVIVAVQQRRRRGAPELPGA
ncbi:MAG: APC family permease, partial [Streptosporangiales bacterium]